MYRVLPCPPRFVRSNADTAPFCNVICRISSSLFDGVDGMFRSRQSAYSRCGGPICPSRRSRNRTSSTPCLWPWQRGDHCRPFSRNCQCHRRRRRRWQRGDRCRPPVSRNCQWTVNGGDWGTSSRSTCTSIEGSCRRWVIHAAYRVGCITGNYIGIGVRWRYRCSYSFYCLGWIKRYWYLFYFILSNQEIGT